MATSRDAAYAVSVAAPVQAAGRQELLVGVEPAAVKQARVWLSELARGHVRPGRLPDLALALTEVVTNAVQHGAPRGRLLIAATPKPEFLCVQVTDEGAFWLVLDSEARSATWLRAPYDPAPARARARALGLDGDEPLQRLGVPPRRADA